MELMAVVSQDALISSEPYKTLFILENRVEGADIGKLFINVVIERVPLGDGCPGPEQQRKEYQADQPCRSARSFQLLSFYSERVRDEALV